ncbi:MAG TPA: hypothetical protein VM283_08425 [Armatimonadota bacterium]|nr:hypothetical protein [Armatimonadota bacterium]
MNKRLGVVALALALVGLAVVVLWVMRQPAGPETPANAVEPHPGSRQGEQGPKLQGVEISGGQIIQRDENGQVQWRAKFGGTISIDEQAQIARHSDVVWELEGGGIEHLKVKAPIMEADLKRRLLTFSQGVDIEAKDGRARFAADQVRYEMGTGKLIGEGQVAFEYGGFTLTGSRLVIDNRNQKVRVSSARLEFD